MPIGKGTFRSPDRRINQENAARTGGLESRGASSASSPLPKHTQQIMEAFLWNKSNSTKHEQRAQTEVQSLILSRLRRPRAQPPDEEQQRLLPRPKQQRSRPLSSTINDEIASNNTFWNRPNPNQQMTINHNVMNRHNEIQPAATTYHQPLNMQIDDIEEEDIVCCDGDAGGYCHEGTKNICTIVLWALIVLAIMNRFFVHMAMYVHKNGSVETTPKYDYGDGDNIGMDEIEIWQQFNATVAEIEGDVR